MGLSATLLTATGTFMNNDAAGMDLSGLSVEGLYDIAVTAPGLGPFVADIQPHRTIEDIGEDIIEVGISGFESGPTSYEYWQRFKNEFRLLLCADDKKYASLRKELSQYGGRAQLAIVSTIAASIAASVGVTVGALVPLCAICLIAVLKMGKEAFCKAETLDVTPAPSETTKPPPRRRRKSRLPC